MLWVGSAYCLLGTRDQSLLVQGYKANNYQLFAVLCALEELLLAGAELTLIRALQPGLNGLVLRVEVVQVRNEVLDDVHVRQGVDLDRLVAGVSFAAKMKKNLY